MKKFWNDLVPIHRSFESTKNYLPFLSTGPGVIIFNNQKAPMNKILLFLFVPFILCSQEIDLKIDYLKYEYEIPMRDGKKLHTAVYVPKDTSALYPIMLGRTPYTTAPYGDEYLKANGNNYWMAEERYIMAFQDVRGRFMSEGEYEDIRPNIRRKEQRAMLMKAPMHSTRSNGC
jgi:predicted acyl esterase